MDGVAHAKLEGVDEAPCYYPTPAQFAEPLEYIASIRQDAERYGICRICPPQGWKPQFAHKPDKLKFATKEQDLVSRSPPADPPPACGPGVSWVDLAVGVCHGWCGCEERPSSTLPSPPSIGER